jgi:hypothetical protein
MSFQAGRKLRASDLNTRFTIQVFIGTAVWTKPDGASKVEVEVVGGGGAGGSTAVAAAGNGATAAGGGGGGYAYKLFDASTLAGTETVTVGVGGTPGLAGANPGGDGADSSFATGKAYVVAGGKGLGGAGGISTGAYIINAGGAGGVASGGDLNLVGAPGVNAQHIGGNPGYQAYGGASMYGFGGKQNSDANGSAGGSYGGGGGGASTATAGAAHQGGAGASGVVLVKVYFG